MKKVLPLIVLAVFLTTLSGCWYNRIDPQSADTARSYKVVGHSTGKVAVFHLFGIIGLKKYASVHEDLDDELKRMATSKGGDDVINLRVVERTECYVVLTREIAFLEGDVIKYQ